MKKLLIVGDSISEGWLGASYIRRLRKSLPGHQFINRGLGADTLAGISQRIPPLLKRHKPATIIIQAGTYDLLLPYLYKRGGTWKALVNQLENRGSVYASDCADFKLQYEQLIEKIQSQNLAITILTISCLGEDVTTPLNQQRIIYNQVIRDLALEYKVCLVDIGTGFTKYLNQFPSYSEYLLDIFLQSYIDRLGTIIDRYTDYLSRKRRLYLTMDGVHLNQKGADLYADSILCQLLRDRDPQARCD